MEPEIVSKFKRFDRHGDKFVPFKFGHYSD